ncbi:MAG TPA: hypothetical protein VGM03_11145 [Phycisphaerae bacterium]
MARHFWTAFVLFIVLAVGSRSNGQPAPLSARTGGMLAGDTTLHRVYRVQNLNGDSDADDLGETSIFFDSTNQSGIGATAGSVFTIFQSVCGAVFIGEGDTDRVYRLVDVNGDGDAQDVGEATVWFGAGNAAGVMLPTPNGIFQDASGATYISNAGVSAAPADFVVRTIDLNGDGDALDAGESSVWLDLSGLQTTTSSPFEIAFIGNAAYISDLFGANPDVVWRAEDVNNNGTIEADELNVFIDDNNAFGVPVAIPMTTDGTSLYVIESTSSVNPQRLFRLTDLNDSHTIEQASEAVEVWNENFLPPGLPVLANVFSIAVGPGGEIAITSNGTDSQDNIFRLVDLNGDGDFMDAGETQDWLTADGTDFPETLRSVQYMLPTPTAVNIAAANPPRAADNPYSPGDPLRDVLDTGTDNTLTAGIGGAGTADQGSVMYATISVTFSAAPSPPLVPCTISVACTDLQGNGDADCPHITAVAGSGSGPYQLTLSAVIPPRECTTLTFAGTVAGEKLQYQSLPGDVDLNANVNTVDLLWLVQRLNDGTANLTANLARYNINRSTESPPVNTTDLLRLVQLLNGVNTTQVFNGATVAPCP